MTSYNSCYTGRTLSFLSNIATLDNIIVLSLWLLHSNKCMGEQNLMLPELPTKVKLNYMFQAWNSNSAPEHVLKKKKQQIEHKIYTFQNF